MDNEVIWKDIPEYEGLYKISNYGEIYSTYSNKLLKPRLDKDGYAQVTLYKNHQPKTLRIHRLVAITYIPNPNNYSCVNHKDENKKNNAVDNLEWCTIKYNNNYGTHTQRSADSRRGQTLSEESRKNISAALKGRVSPNKGKKFPTEWRANLARMHCKPVGNNLGEQFTSTIEAALMTNIPQANISACCRGKRKSAGKDINGNKIVWFWLNNSNSKE